MTHKGEDIRAAIGLPQRLPVHKAGKRDIVRGLLHGLPDLLGDQMGIRPAEPEETGLRHPPGQLQKLRQPLPGNGVAHGDHRPLPLPEAPAAAEGCPPGRIRREELRVHAVGDAVHRRLEAVALQQTAGVFRGGQHHVAQAVAEGDPLAEERGQPVRAPEGAAEVLHGGVAVVNDLPPQELGRQGRQHRIRQHRVDMDGPGPLAPMVGSVDPGPAQHLPLVKDGLSHAASAHQAQSALVNENAHRCLLFFPPPRRSSFS